MDNFTAPHSIVHMIIALDAEGCYISLNKKCLYLLFHCKIAQFSSLTHYDKLKHLVKLVRWCKVKTHLVIKVTTLLNCYLLSFLLICFSLPLALFRLHFHRLFSQQQKQQSNTLPNYCQHGKVIKVSQINKETLPKGTVLTGCS